RAGPGGVRPLAGADPRAEQRGNLRHRRAPGRAGRAWRHACSPAASYRGDERHRRGRHACGSPGAPRSLPRRQHARLRQDRPCLAADAGRPVRAGAVMTLHEELGSYLAARRSLGYKLTTSEYLLAQFCGWLAAHGKFDTFTIDDAVACAREPATAQPVWW